MKFAENTILSIVVGLVPNFFLCWLYKELVDGDWKDFFLACAVLQGIYFFLWFITAVLQWRLFWTYGKRSISRSTEKFLKEGKFPAWC